nr:LuxR C-terminal-related transcriptional regulator [Hyphomonas sp. Mor2]
MAALSQGAIQSALQNIETAHSASQAFNTVSEIAKKLGFESCVVFEAILSVNGNPTSNGLKGDSIAVVFNDRTNSAQKKQNDVFDTIDPALIPGGRKFIDPPFHPFATGSNWHRANNKAMSAEDQAFYDMMDKIRGPLGVIVFPVRSAQTGFSPLACVAMESHHSAEWLSEFLENVAPSIMPIISAFEEQLFPHLLEREIQRVDLSEREIDCLRLLAKGLDTKNIAHQLGITATMTSRHLRKAQKKLRVSNTAAATLKAQKLGLVRF